MGRSVTYAVTKADHAPDSLEPLILIIRNQRVILDADLARLQCVCRFRSRDLTEANPHPQQQCFFNRIALLDQ